MMQTLNLVYGPPGVGKTTVFRSLLEKYPDIAYISIGEAYRREVSQKTDLGKELESYVKAIKEYPPALIERLAQAAIDEVRLPIIVLDGFPKYEVELQPFLHVIRNKQLDINKVVVLENGYEILVKQVEARIVCENCGKQQDVGNGKCIACGSTHLVKRDDDEVTIFKRRFDDYIRSRDQVLPFLSSIGYAIVNIDASKSPDEVLAKVEASGITVAHSKIKGDLPE